MPYANIKNPEDILKMESCVAQVQADGKPKQAAIAICYSSIAGKKVLLSPYPVPDIPIGDLIPPEGGDPLSWQQVSERTDEWAQKQLSRRETAAKARCSVQGCTASPTQLVTVKGAVLPYCEEHLPGAKDVLARHSIKVEGVRSAEQVWVDAKGLQFITNEDGRVIPIGGPSGGGGGSSPGKSFSEAVTSGKITSSDKLPGGIVKGAIVNYEDDGSGIVKKMDAAGGAHDGNSEVAAYRINQLLGGDDVPETVYVEINGRKAGTSQHFVEGARVGMDGTLADIKNANPQNIDRIIALDAIIGNMDRHGGNFLIKDGRVIAIDHGHAKWKPLAPRTDPLFYNQILASVESKGQPLSTSLSGFWAERSGQPYVFSKQSLDTWRGITRQQFDRALSGVSESGNVNLNNAWQNLQRIIEQGEA